MSRVNLSQLDLLARTDDWFRFTRIENNPHSNHGFQYVRTRVENSFAEALLLHRIELAMAGMYSVPSKHSTGSGPIIITINGWVNQHGNEETKGYNIRFVATKGAWFTVIPGMWRTAHYEDENEGLGWQEPEIISVMKIEEFDPVTGEPIPEKKEVPKQITISEKELDTIIMNCLDTAKRRAFTAGVDAHAGRSGEFTSIEQAFKAYEEREKK
jgi:hypothetical protein